MVRRFNGLTSMAVVGLTGVDAVATSEIRKRLVSKGIRLMVIKNAPAKQAFKTVGLDMAVDLLNGPCAIATGGDSVVDVVRELLGIARDTPDLTVKAAVLEGDAFGPDRIEELSRYPTRDEAIRILVSCVVWPGRRLGAALVAPGRKAASLVKVIKEKGGSGEAEDTSSQDGNAAPCGSASPAEAAAAKEKEIG